MYFETLQQVIQMGGHGIYVWSSYAVTFIVLIALVIHPWLLVSRYKAQVAAKIHRNQKAASLSKAKPSVQQPNNNQQG